MDPPTGTYRLVGTDGRHDASPTKGTTGGNSGTRIFGRLDCPAALRAIERGGYVRQRVFFADPETAAQAGYRPCAVCMPDRYRAWKDGDRPDGSTVGRCPGRVGRGRTAAG